MSQSARAFGMVIGGLVGLVFAAMLCGTIAFMALVEQHLRAIAENSGRTPSNASSGARKEPQMTDDWKDYR
ncbi:hypothetical protein [Devosia sp. FJ2-5-3]|uniref:hypothetical protein n=1 Tax=Devosia sp. FJ2-5-3 TaxID=2976680 RepID=UPI0023D83B0D|nr:hypothetical protein [Devosia sp. FJ2-5-3]WEJ57666.1 hypothetical protein N0P34_15900 [Devosia sp. FJ2-5-3]